MTKCNKSNTKTVHKNNVTNIKGVIREVCLLHNDCKYPYFS